MSADTKKQISIVDYFVIDDGAPYLRANECTSCGALFLDRRDWCARCGGDEFKVSKLADTGTIRSYSVVYRASAGVPAPYVSVLIDLDGGGVVKGNLLVDDPDPEAVKLGSQVRLSTYVAGVDDRGTEAIAFGFVPA